MSESKEFLGKTLDAAIAEACAYYDVPREKLEIDIIEDAKTGIFGIVGARKAKIRARLAKLPDFMQNPLQQEKPERQEGRRRGRGERRREKTESAEVAKEENRERREGAKEKRQDDEKEREVPAGETRVLPALRTAGVPALAPAVEPPAGEIPAEEETQEEPDAPTEEAPRSRRSRQSRASRKESAPKNEDADALESTLPRVPLAELDQERLAGTTKNIISRLVAPILDVDAENVDLSLEIGEDRVQVSVKSEDTGLLIGRDGQNLAAVQYLASRMITRAMGSQVRLQVDAGDYHVRQDSRLQELALSLAEKVKATGKVQTTRPLSAYQRRVIHLALQDDPDVQTRSSGDGPLKHVVILRRKD
ncbi:protein jag [uncultured Mailhella sp.]|uniref:Jag family protein n=1 Tax=uncultured Mailhella sp. TaxID=1981031 RepID=UPI0025D95E9A|nr:protein jag [uncultured Mailhella sp.]